MWFFLPVITGVSILVACCLVLRFHRVRGLADYFLLGLALQIVLSLPAGIFQSLWGWGYLSFPWWVALLLPLAGWPYNVGGVLARACVLGFDSHWVSSPSHYFLAVTIQVCVLALIFAIRCRSRRTFNDPVVGAIVVFTLVNSAMNARWEWLVPA